MAYTDVCLTHLQDKQLFYNTINNLDFSFFFKLTSRILSNLPPFSVTRVLSKNLEFHGRSAIISRIRFFDDFESARTKLSTMRI